LRVSKRREGVKLYFSRMEYLYLKRLLEPLLELSEYGDEGDERVEERASI